MPHKRTIPRVCQTCAETFLATPREVQQGRARFCSLACVRQPVLPTRDADINYLADGSARLPLYARDSKIRAYVIVDAGDVDFAKGWRWRLGSDGYAKRGERVDGIYLNVYLHRELLGLPRRTDGREGDHRNRVRLDCRRSNLRILPRGVNLQNQPSQRTSTSAYRGVSWSASHRKWVAVVGTTSKTIWVGQFDSERAAAEAAKVARACLLPYALD